MSVHTEHIEFNNKEACYEAKKQIDNMQGMNDGLGKPKTICVSQN